MCRMLAISSRRAPSAGLMEKFKVLALEGQTPGLGADARGHTDGWGMAACVGQRVLFEKSALSATDAQGGWDDAVRRLLVPTLWPGHAIFHLRRASPGIDVRVANSHPFHRKRHGRDWFFMGNGTVEGFDPTEHEGQVDTEYFMDRVMENLEDGGDLKEAIARGKAALTSRYAKYTSLVGIFLHPRGLEAYYDVSDKFDRYHTIFRAESEGSVILCSEKLEVEGLTWAPWNEMGGVLTVPSFRRG